MNLWVVTPNGKAAPICTNQGKMKAGDYVFNGEWFQLVSKGGHTNLLALWQVLDSALIGTLNKVLGENKQ